MFLFFDFVFVFLFLFLFFVFVFVFAVLVLLFFLTLGPPPPTHPPKLSPAAPSEWADHEGLRTPNLSMTIRLSAEGGWRVLNCRR